jgi:AcrR family transcriptional regulator
MSALLRPFRNTNKPSRSQFALPQAAMTARRTARISSRKQPKQARSTDLVAAILEAALQVLAKEGAQRFTTVRVAEKAGVSVGSLYQYFPNKAAILFRLQSDEWRQTTALLHDILEDSRRPPLQRLRILVHAFLRSECDEAAVRVALDDAAPLYRDAPEAKAAKASGEHAIQNFMREALPKASKAKRALAGELVKTTLSAFGTQFSATPRTAAEIETYATAMADMFCAYLKSME